MNLPTAFPSQLLHPLDGVLVVVVVVAVVENVQTFLGSAGLSGRFPSRARVPARIRPRPGVDVDKARERPWRAVAEVTARVGRGRRVSRPAQLRAVERLQVRKVRVAVRDLRGGVLVRRSVVRLLGALVSRGRPSAAPSSGKGRLLPLQSRQLLRDRVRPFQIDAHVLRRPGAVRAQQRPRA